MSITRLPSGAFRAQVWDVETCRNLSVGKVLGGLSTFETWAEADAARQRARGILKSRPHLTEAERAAQARQEVAERLERAEQLRRRRWEAAAKRRATIRDRRDRLLALHTPDPETGCWEWQGSLDLAGYGRIRSGRGGHVRAHRWFFEQIVGRIPTGMVLDHLCRNPRCVNPEHLDPVTSSENIRRGAVDRLP